MAKSIKIDGGKNCPKCNAPMQRCAHGATWKPKEGQPYYFKFWDICRRCRHMQHYEAAKVWVDDVGERLSAIRTQLEGVR